MKSVVASFFFFGYPENGQTKYILTVSSIWYYPSVLLLNFGKSNKGKTEALIRKKGKEIEKLNKKSLSD